jgi:sarcosine oxidase, subunit gamma
MADTLVAASVFEALSLPNHAQAFSTRSAGAMARFSYRGPDAVVASAFGVAHEGRPLRAVTTGERSVLWLGPDERLLLAPVAASAAIRTAFAAAAAATPHSLVDVSCRNDALIVDGPSVCELIATACPLDLDPQAFPVGMCTRTVFAKAEIILWRQAVDRFHIEAWRSFWPYLTALMTETGRSLRSAEQQGGIRQ